MEYEIEYPTGYILNQDWHRVSKSHYSIENSELTFQTESVWEEKKSIVTLMDEREEELWTWERPTPLPPYLRAQVVDGELWFCEESWNTGLGYLYLDGLLEYGTLYQLDMASGEILCERQTGENEFYLTKIGERFYFYQRGGRWEHAQLYYRELSDWEEKHELYQFDYKGAPEETGGGYVLRFIIGEEAITTEYWNTEVYQKVGEYRGDEIYEKTEELLWSKKVALERE